MLYYFKNKIKCFLLRKRVKTGKWVTISNTFFEGKNTLFDKVNIVNSFVGFGSYIQKNCNIVCCSIGRYCSIADHVHTCIGSHPTNFLSTYPAFYYDTTEELGYSYHTEKPIYDVLRYPDIIHDYQIKIGNDVWIGSHVLILGGVSIGDGAIIAAGAVVTKDVPPYSIVAGVPAKLVKKRFESHLIDFLINFRWWDKSEDWIISNYRKFSDPCSFYERHKDC